MTRQMGKRIVTSTILVFMPLCMAIGAETRMADVTHVTVRHENGRCFGWPANGGIRRLKTVNQDVGEQGKMLSGFGGGRNVLLPAAKFEDYQRPAPTLPRTVGHYREWTEGCKTNTPTNCPMDFGCQMTETALLGTLALRRLIPDQPSIGWSAKLLDWDADAMRITNDDTANAFVNPPYRKGWSL